MFNSNLSWRFTIRHKAKDELELTSNIIRLPADNLVQSSKDVQSFSWLCLCATKHRSFGVCCCMNIMLYVCEWAINLLLCCIYMILDCYVGISCCFGCISWFLVNIYTLFCVIGWLFCVISCSRWIYIYSRYIDICWAKHCSFVAYMFIFISMVSISLENWNSAAAIIYWWHKECWFSLGFGKTQ